MPLLSLIQSVKPRKRPRVQECRKRLAGACQFCGEDDYALLDAHRIQEGGPYCWGNLVVLCANCHRRAHAGAIAIHRWCPSSFGPVLYCTVDGKEVWLKEKVGGENHRQRS